jgi:hypothetical protein
MSKAYEELIDDLPTLRLPPGQRHEAICRRLHARVSQCLPGSLARLMPARAQISLAPGLTLRPDLALLTAAHGKLWLAAEIISPSDHETDTVTKKSLYEDHRLARLWMIDPRYDNVEVYHGTPYGLQLKAILAGQELLQERLLPGFALPVTELFEL